MKDDESAKLRTIFSRDEHPEGRFGCSFIEDVVVEYQPDEGIVDVIIITADPRSSAKPIKTLLRSFDNCRRGGSDSTRELSKRIRVFVEAPGKRDSTKDRRLLYPEEPTDIQVTVSGEIVEARFDIDIEDMDGTTKITDVYTLNATTEKGLQSILSWLEGYEAVDWQDLELQAFLRTDAEETEVETVHKYSEDSRKAHWWKVVFKERGKNEIKTVKMGQSCQVWHYSKGMKASCVFSNAGW